MCLPFVIMSRNKLKDLNSKIKFQEDSKTSLQLSYNCLKNEFEKYKNNCNESSKKEIGVVKKELNNKIGKLEKSNERLLKLLVGEYDKGILMLFENENNIDPLICKDGKFINTAGLVEVNATWNKNEPFSIQYEYN